MYEVLLLRFDNVTARSDHATVAGAKAADDSTDASVAGPAADVAAAAATLLMFMVSGCCYSRW